METINPLLSICIPTYKRGKMLTELLDAILLQISEKNRDKIEIVISNNPSEGDDTASMVAPYIQQYPYIHFFKNETNLGFLNTVKITEYAKGEYICMLADDDFLTDDAVESIIEIIQKTKFDILFHKPFFSEDVHVSVMKTENNYTEYPGISAFIGDLLQREKEYKHLISFFSFYSAKIVKAAYLHDARNQVDKQILAKNNFPHEFVNYCNLQDKKIIFPDKTLVIGRILNESYPGSVILIENLKEVMNYIEQQNNLQDNKDRKKVKKICINGRTRMIYLGIWIRKLGLDYKKNPILKAVYYFYKKYIQ